MNPAIDFQVPTLGQDQMVQVGSPSTPNNHSVPPTQTFDDALARVADSAAELVPLPGGAGEDGPGGGGTEDCESSSDSSAILALSLVAAADADDKPMEMPTCIMGMDVHPLANLVPGPTPREFRNLREDILKHGVRHPPTRFNGMLIDGRSTAMACTDLGIVPNILDLPEGTDALAYIKSVNVHRRHLTKLQLAIFAVAAHEWVHSGYNQHSGGGAVISPPATNEETATWVGGSTRLIQQAKVIHQAGLDQDVLAKGLTWKDVLSRAAKILKKTDLEDPIDCVSKPNQNEASEQSKANANAATKGPRKTKLPEDVVELRRMVRERDDEIHELDAALEREKAEVGSLRDKCEELEQENARLEGEIARLKPEAKLHARETVVQEDGACLVNVVDSTASGSKIHPRETVEHAAIIPFQLIGLAGVTGE